MQSACSIQRCHWADKREACPPCQLFSQRGKKAENWLRLSLETGGGEARLPKEGQGRCLGNLPCPAAPGVQTRQTIFGNSRLGQRMGESVRLLWNWETWLVPGEEGRECVESWPPQLKSESIDRARKWERHLPAVQEQSEAQGLPVGFLRQRGMVSSQRKSQKLWRPWLLRTMIWKTNPNTSHL